ncbi:MAG: hypothetical protein KIT84_27120 [Labilithrix sp.]|nr:hypothetical protein [Labilithrix sp.]MCW5814728.1 hypothetical protein [Labilithrix sp.]
MLEAGMTLIAILLLTGLVAFVAARFERSMRRWIWLAFVEYLVASAAQMLYTRVIYSGGDALLYLSTGVQISTLLDVNFSFVAPEVLALLFQRPSMFDEVVYGGGGRNTSSMHAIATIIVYVFRGSTYAANVFVAGLSFLGATAIFAACRAAAREIPWQRIFLATVIFPSVAFWTATFNKEAFALMGIGALLTAWRGFFQRRWLLLVLSAPVGFTLLYLFRAPALAPLFVGFAVHYVAERGGGVGEKAARLRPAYVLLGVLALAVGMLALTRLIPSLGVANLGETVATQQRAWTTAGGTSTFAMDDGEVPQSFGGQLLRIPIGLFNALLRPQLFDVHNVSALVSAVEMTFITYLLLRAVKVHGFRGVIAHVQRSPFLLMCFVVTLIGCAFVGLVTFNFGSLARYRVPFLPFYGCLLSGIADRVAAPARARTTANPALVELARRRGRRAA